MELLTIGHSNHSIEDFISLLEQHRVTALADVRSHPYSRFLPHFQQKNLKRALDDRSITYVFLGGELGARPSNPECYLEGKAIYEKIAATEAFQLGIQRITKGLATYKIALMCAEKDPLTCHRAILVCPRLRNFNLEINHILADGNLESHDRLEERMLEKHGFAKLLERQQAPIQLSLFSEPTIEPISREEYLDRAYRLQGDKIAYQEIKETEANNETFP
jgi:uncharacterized protein (DUF488 family)